MQTRSFSTTVRFSDFEISIVKSLRGTSNCSESTWRHFQAKKYFTVAKFTSPLEISVPEFQVNYLKDRTKHLDDLIKEQNNSEFLLIIKKNETYKSM